MFYSFPKKIQYKPSQAKWSVQSIKSVLLIVGLNELKQQANWSDSTLAEHIQQLSKKAQALEVPIILLNPSLPQQGMMQLGQYLSENSIQVIVAGQMAPLMKQVIEHISNVADQICIVNDAVLTGSKEQHIQSIDALTVQGIHHMNVASLTRLWSLSAPKELILSDKGIVLAVAEQLDLAPLDLDPSVDLRHYGLDSVAMVSLISLWRANGAEITYESFLTHMTLEQLVRVLKN